MPSEFFPGEDSPVGSGRRPRETNHANVAERPGGRKAQLLPNSGGNAAAVWDPVRLDRPRLDSQRWYPLLLRGIGFFVGAGARARVCDGRCPSALLGRARVPVADQEARSNRSCSETFATGAMGHRIWIRYFESAFL